MLSQNHNILLNDSNLRKIFEDRPIVAFRRRKNIRNFLCRNDVRKKQEEGPSTCKGCKLCRLMSREEVVVNRNNGATVKIKPGSCCQTTGVIYAISCKKCQKIYVGHTGESMAKRWSKHKYDIRNRPDQNELATHCHKDHDLEKDLEIFILDHGHHHLGQRERLEDRYICQLQTLQTNGGGMNKKVHAYAKEMYELWNRVHTASRNP